MKVWDEAGCGLVRFDLTAGSVIEADQLFHDNIVLLSFEGCRWTTRSGGISRGEAPGSVVVRDAGQVFSIKAEHIDLGGGTCREIHIAPARLAAFFDEPDCPLPAIDFSRSLIEDAGLARALLRAHRLFENPHCTLEASVHFLQLMTYVAQHTSRAPQKRAAKACAGRNAAVIDFMRGHYDQALSLQQLGGMFDINPFVLLRQFQAQYGISPHEYLSIHRVNQAKALIKRGERLVDVAQMCGFCDQSHLTRQFKRRTGLTPGQFVAERPAATH